MELVQNCDKHETERAFPWPVLMSVTFSQRVMHWDNTETNSMQCMSEFRYMRCPAKMAEEILFETC